MVRCTFLAVVLVIPLGSARAATFTPDDDPPSTNTFALLVEQGRLVLSAEGQGGHTGDCLKVRFTNTTDKSLATTMPAGWLFVSDDTTLQDLLVVREEVLALDPGATRSVSCRAFCCEATMGSPAENSLYGRSRQADAALTGLAQFIAANRFPDSAVQDAVWAVSDGRPISAIRDDLTASVKPLREQVAQLTGRELPWYTTEYATPADGRLVSDEPTRITGSVEYSVRHNAQMTVVLRDGEGRTIRPLSSDHFVGPGRFTMDVVLTVQGFPQGHYSICFLHDAVMVKEIGFDL